MMITILELDKKEVVAILTKHLKDSGFDVQEIEFDVDYHEKGNQMDPYTVTEFNGCKVKVLKELVI